MTEQESKIQHDAAVDATVMDEKPGSPQGAEALPYEQTVLFVLLVFLAGATLSLHQNLNFSSLYHSDRALVTLRLPVLVEFRTAENTSESSLHNQETQLTSFADVASQAKEMRMRAAHLNKVPDVPPEAKIPPVGSHLTAKTYRVMLDYLAQKEGIFDEKDARDVLLKAGYKLPPPIGVGNKKRQRDHAAFARDMVNELVKSEVESFLHKLNVVSKVGVYAVGEE